MSFFLCSCRIKNRSQHTASQSVSNVTVTLINSRTLFLSHLSNRSSVLTPSEVDPSKMTKVKTQTKQIDEHTLQVPELSSSGN